MVRDDDANLENEMIAIHQINVYGILRVHRATLPTVQAVGRGTV